MYKRLVEKASSDQLKEFINDHFIWLKEHNKEMYNEAIMQLYKKVNGCHFDEEMLKQATSEMVNEDGTRGAHWSVEDTNTVATQYGITYDHFNQYDWNYVMNMMYSDYYGAVSNDIKTYVNLSKKFLIDKDAPKGKAMYYYWAMH